MPAFGNLGNRLATRVTSDHEWRTYKSIIFFVEVNFHNEKENTKWLICMVTYVKNTNWHLSVHSSYHSFRKCPKRQLREQTKQVCLSNLSSQLGIIGKNLLSNAR